MPGTWQGSLFFLLPVFSSREFEIKFGSGELWHSDDEAVAKSREHAAKIAEALGAPLVETIKKSPGVVCVS